MSTPLVRWPLFVLLAIGLLAVPANLFAAEADAAESEIEIIDLTDDAARADGAADVSPPPVEAAPLDVPAPPIESAMFQPERATRGGSGLTPEGISLGVTLHEGVAVWTVERTRSWVTVSGGDEAVAAEGAAAGIEVQPEFEAFALDDEAGVLAMHVPTPAEFEFDVDDRSMPIPAENDACAGEGSIHFGHLRITSEEDLAGFCDAGYAVVEGDLVVEMAVVPNLDGLECLCGVSGDVLISTNTLLQNIDGLANLRYIGDDFALLNDNGLVDVNGMRSLTRVGGDFVVDTVRHLGGPGGGTLGGFASLQEVGGDFVVHNCPSVIHMDGFSMLRAVGGTFTLAANPGLATVEGFSSLRTVGGDLVLEDNPGLAAERATTLAPEGKVVGGEVRVASNATP